METWVKEKIARLNQEFYQTFSKSFAATRHRIQPGVARILGQVPRNGNWLDIGCGNGTLALALTEQSFQGSYLGCDLSQDLIEDAQKKINARQKSDGLSIDFKIVDINQPEWMGKIPEIDWNWISLFAVLHHIPSHSRRQSLCLQIRELLPPSNPLFISTWQLQNSPRLLPRVKPWRLAGLKNEDVEEGDVLMDWRAGISKKDISMALRYVHIFSENELRLLAEGANFRVVDSFYSDGKEGNLALYQIWN